VHHEHVGFDIDRVLGALRQPAERIGERLRRQRRGKHEREATAAAPASARNSETDTLRRSVAHWGITGSGGSASACGSVVTSAAPVASGAACASGAESAACRSTPLAFGFSGGPSRLIVVRLDEVDITLPRKVRVCSPEWNVSALALHVANGQFEVDRTMRAERLVFHVEARVLQLAAHPRARRHGDLSWHHEPFGLAVEDAAHGLHRDQPPFALDRSALMA